jgi:hypothetical protein
LSIVAVGPKTKELICTAAMDAVLNSTKKNSLNKSFVVFVGLLPSYQD